MKGIARWPNRGWLARSADNKRAELGPPEEEEQRDDVEEGGDVFDYDGRCVI